MKTKIYLSISFILCLFFGALFWLNILLGLGNATYLSSMSGKFILMILVFVSSIFCLTVNIIMITDQRYPAKLMHGISVLLGAGIFISSFVILLYGHGYF